MDLDNDGFGTQTVYDKVFTKGQSDRIKVCLFVMLTLRVFYTKNKIFWVLVKKENVVLVLALMAAFKIEYA